jgi:hypothetical protein
VRSALDSALHAAAVGGVQLTFLVSGVVGVLAGFAVLALVRPTKTDGAADGPGDVAAKEPEAPVRA